MKFGQLMFVVVFQMYVVMYDFGIELKFVAWCISVHSAGY